MDREQIEALLSKHKNGDCNAEEIEMIEQWLFSINNKPKAEIDNKGLQQHIIQTKKMLDLVIDKHEDKISRAAQLRKTSFSYLKIAAAIAVIVSFSVLLNSKREEVDNIFFPLKYTTLTTKAGKRSRVDLSDGSVIWLNSGSSISFNNRYNKKNREIILNGEAFFEVTKGSMPFFVKTGKLRTKVLGTTFNIQAYPSSKNIEVALLTGKIWLNTGKQNAVLVPNQSVVFDRLSEKLGPVKDEQTSGRAAWKDGTFVFNDTPLDEVFQRLQRAYDLDFDIQGKRIRNLKFNGKFNMNEPAEEIIKSICKLIDAKYTLRQNKVFIK